MRRVSITLLTAALALAIAAPPAAAAARPHRAKNGMVVSQNFIASQVGVDVLWEGGTAVDAAVATAFALAVVHPAAGNVGGGGFLLYRPAKGSPVAYDFREMAPAGSSPTMFLKPTTARDAAAPSSNRDARRNSLPPSGGGSGGRDAAAPSSTYDEKLHHESHLAVGVPGTVAGLHMAWKEHGKLPWRRLVEPAIELARQGFLVTHTLARSLRDVLPEMKAHRASVDQFSRSGTPYEPGDLLRQPDLADTLERIAERGPSGFYSGKTAELIEREMQAHGGLITREDLAAYRPIRREPLRGAYRGYEVLAMPPVSSGGVALLTMLNVLEGYDLKATGFSSAATVHLMAEAMRRAFAERARWLGDPEFNPDMPTARLVSKEHAAELRKTIALKRASVSSPQSFEWPAESQETTHLSVVDADRGAVSLTYTLEDSYGSKIVVPGAGFLLNNEMGDFNAGPRLTNEKGLIGTEPNLAQPRKRMLSSMTPTILVKDDKPFLVIGTPGGRTIINTVLQAIVNVVDFGMNVQEAINAPRFHHQWLPDRILHEKHGLSPDTIALLLARGHTLEEGKNPQGAAQGIVYVAAEDVLEGAADPRDRDSAAVGR